jgi:hypothetical protein
MMAEIGEILGNHGRDKSLDTVLAGTEAVIGRCVRFVAFFGNGCARRPALQAGAKIEGESGWIMPSAWSNL